MEIEKKFDRILDILFDESSLHWKSIPSTDLIVFAKKKYGIDWSDVELNFIMKILQDDGYVVLNPGDFSDSNMKMPSYSLTTKGILMKLAGGFAQTKRVEIAKQRLILWGSIIALIVSFITVYDFVEKHLVGEEKKNECCCCKDDMNNDNVTQISPKTKSEAASSNTIQKPSITLAEK